jgi:hypothetical protein
MRTPLVYDHNLARVTTVAGTRVELAYDLDRERWPWLALPPHHPVLVEKYQYFSAVTASLATGPAVPPTFAALTRFRWSCTPAAWQGRYATRGLCEIRLGERELGYSLAVRDDDGRDLYRMSGEGFAFRDRDFPAWREKSRRAAQETAGERRIAPAPAPAVGLGPNGRSFVTPLTDVGGRLEATALVPTHGGFHPAHPFHTGSGDHVNAGHLFDCALQVVHLALGPERPARLACTGGEARFIRFVELDVPFTVALTGRARRRDELALQLSMSQGGRDNAVISLEVSDGGPAAADGPPTR